MQSNLIRHPPLSFITTVNETQASAVLAVVVFFIASYIGQNYTLVHTYNTYIQNDERIKR